MTVAVCNAVLKWKQNHYNWHITNVQETDSSLSFYSWYLKHLQPWLAPEIDISKQMLEFHTRQWFCLQIKKFQIRIFHTFDLLINEKMNKKKIFSAIYVQIVIRWETSILNHQLCNCCIMKDFSWIKPDDERMKSQKWLCRKTSNCKIRIKTTQCFNILEKSFRVWKWVVKLAWITSMKSSSF